MIVRIETDEQIEGTRAVMCQLRPHLGPDTYLPAVRRLMTSDNYRLAAAVEGGGVRAVAGYRIMEMLYCGRMLYIDDLVSDEQVRSRGWGKQLLDWLKQEGRNLGCRELHLDSAVRREQAHRFYFREGLAINLFHFYIAL